jgi:hypothetical protein
MHWSKRSSGWCCGKCWRARRFGGHLHCSWCVVRQAHHEGIRCSAKCNLPHGEPVEPRTTVLPPQIKTTPTYPPRPIRAYPSRVLSGGNASGNFRKSGKDRRFGFTGRKPVRPGRFGSMVAHWVKPSKTPGRVVPRIASIAYHIPQDPRSRDRPSFPPFNSQTRQRAWQRRRALQNNHAWFDRLTMREVV